MSVKDRQDIGQEATVPDNTLQSPVFGAPTEVVKDAFLLELRHFFETSNAKLRLSELPRIDKYSVSDSTETDPLETAVNIIRSFPDVSEDFPLIAVLSTTGRNLKLGIGEHYTELVVPNAEIISTTTAPFVLTDGMTITVTSMPTGQASNIVTSTFSLPSFLFTDIGAATLDEVIAVINAQALYVTAYKSVSAGVEKLALKAGGPKGTHFPNKITITGGTALTALGFTVNATDQNYGSGKKAYHRHHMSTELTVSLEVVAESENVRTELTDLLSTFLAYVLEDKKYQFYGRSSFDKAVQDEYYQIIIKDNDISLSGEMEVPRLGDNRDKLYINRISVPCVVIQYSDREAVNKDGTTATPTVLNLNFTDELPGAN